VNAARRWWDDADERAEEPAVPVDRRHSDVRVSPPRRKFTAAEWSATRADLALKASLLPRGSSRRVAIERRLVKATAELLRLELKP
jgi:hypothetical protein